MTERPKPDAFLSKSNRLALLSDRILGSPQEIDVTEANELLQAAGQEPEELKARFHQRFDRLAKDYAAKGQRVPPLLKQALADFRPGLAHSSAERKLFREAQSAVRQLLKQVKQIRELLEKTPSLTFAAAYRKKKDLSERDQNILDEIATNLASRKNTEKRGVRPKGRT